MLAGQASKTARAVAAVRVDVERAPAPYGDPGAADRLEHDVADETAESPLGRYLAARTRFFDRQVVAALDGGVDQVITAAAGYDARALRYARPSVRWFEVDHPDTQADKRAVLARLGLDASGIRFVAADFGIEDVAGRLAAAGCEPNRRSLVLAEGIAVYLSVPVLTRLLDGLRRAVRHGSRLVISLSVEANSTERTARRADFQQRVAGVGEPARSTLTAAEGGPLLASAGWKLDARRTEATERRLALGFVTATAAAATKKAPQA